MVNDRLRGMVRRALACGVSAALVFTVAGCGCSSSKPVQDEEVQTEATQEEPVDQTTAGQQTTEQQTSETEVAPASDRLDLLVLVNADHALPEGWEERLDLVEVVNPKGDTVRIDRIAYDKFLELKSDLANQGVTIELNSGYRSIEEQQAIWDEFMVDYGEEYVREFVAVPGHSEHHTGIALDAYLVLDGVPQLTNDEIFAAQDTWDIIHASLADHGFILRYLNGADDITGYSYEPWHFRYVGDQAAHEIAARGCTLEEYLGAV